MLMHFLLLLFLMELFKDAEGTILHFRAEKNMPYLKPKVTREKNSPLERI